MIGAGTLQGESEEDVLVRAPERRAESLTQIRRILYPGVLRLSCGSAQAAAIKITCAGESKSGGSRGSRRVPPGQGLGVRSPEPMEDVQHGG